MFRLGQSFNIRKNTDRNGKGTINSCHFSPHCCSCVATVVALETFNKASENSNIDAVNEELSMLVSSAQSYYLKSSMLGGGGRSFTNIDFTQFAFSARPASDDDPLVRVNENATFVISGVTESEFIVTGTISDQRGTTASARVCPRNVRMGDIGFRTAPAPPACM